MGYIFKHDIENLKNYLEPGMHVKFNRGYDNYGQPVVIEGTVEHCYPNVFSIHGILEMFTYTDLYLGRQSLERRKQDD